MSRASDTLYGFSNNPARNTYQDVRAAMEQYDQESYQQDAKAEPHDPVAQVPYKSRGIDSILMDLRHSRIGNKIANALLGLAVWSNLSVGSLSAAELSRGNEECLIKYLNSKPAIQRAIDDKVHEQVSGETEAQRLKNLVESAILNPSTIKMTREVEMPFWNAVVTTYQFRIDDASGRTILSMQLDKESYCGLDQKIREINCDGCESAQYSERSDVDALLKKYYAGAHPIHADFSVGEALFGIVGGFAGSHVAGQIRGGDGGNNGSSIGGKGPGFDQPQNLGNNAGFSEGAAR
ncbi:hypothetical protein HY641_02370 [Candidatus Woesearchaeota archaeon]|nr:hypothetical protein [Candidatus Woesearchaeota archaeon]